MNDYNQDQSTPLLDILFQQAAKQQQEAERERRVIEAIRSIKDVPPQKDLKEMIKDGVSTFLSDNKGVLITAAASYILAKNNGKSNQDALKQAGLHAKHAKEIENFYNWFLRKIRN